MIRLTTHNGVEVDIEAINDPERVHKILTNCLQPDAYKDLKNKALEYEEVFFQFTAARKVDLPMLCHHLVHLDSRTQDPDNLMVGDWIQIIHVPKDHLEAAEELAKSMIKAVKNLNSWEETTRFEVTDENIFKLPTFGPEDNL
jgi:hypothetical protein